MLQALKMRYMGRPVHVMHRPVHDIRRLIRFMRQHITARMFVLHYSTILAITFDPHIQMILRLKHWKTNTQIYNMVVTSEMFEYYFMCLLCR